MQEAKNDPIKKADLIRDMVNSISKIPDRIKREIYVQETARIMDISEDVLFNTLAQIVKKDIQELSKKHKEDQKAFEVHKNDDPQPNSTVDVQYFLEYKIIEILLLYGNLTEDFEDIFLKENENGEMIETKEINSYKVFNRVYLSLQEDEVAFTNPVFQMIFDNLWEFYNAQQDFELEKYLLHASPEIANAVTNILMQEEKENLHNWETKQIYVKQKNQTVSQYVTETILTLRWYLVNKIIDDLKNNIGNSQETDNQETLSMVIDYLGLTNLFSKKLGRVISRHIT
jgi:DNA primase